MFVHPVDRLMSVYAVAMWMLMYPYCMVKELPKAPLTQLKNCHLGTSEVIEFEALSYFSSSYTCTSTFLKRMVVVIVSYLRAQLLKDTDF